MSGTQSQLPEASPDEGTTQPAEMEGDDEDVFRDMSFEEVLEELTARFLANLPEEEMSLVRVYWQAEQAHWFYEDYLRPLNPTLPTYSQRTFTHRIVASSPLFAAIHGGQGGIDYDAVWDEYCRYKRMVPCCGGILVNAKGDKVLMVRGWKSNAGWCFPRGKINSEESEVACAIREVKEETGFDLTGLIKERDMMQTQINAQTVTMFIVGGIDEATAFVTETKNEIGAIEWVKLVDLPTWTGKKAGKTASKSKRFYNVTPFVGPLKRWLQENGYNPYPKAKKSSGTAPVGQPANAPSYRNLQPYAFEGHPESPHPARSTTATALDHLFNKFVHKQEIELDNPENEAVTGADERGGLERLFGNLNVLKEEEEEGRRRQEKDEDEALASLLGGPLPQRTENAHTPVPTTEKAAKLLDILKNASPIPSVPSPEHSPSPAIQTLKPHQSSLLAVLSPKTGPPRVADLPAKPLSLPTSPRPPSPSLPQDYERARKQRALLEQITAGMGDDLPASQLALSSFSEPVHDNPNFSFASPGTALASVGAAARSAVQAQAYQPPSSSPQRVYQPATLQALPPAQHPPSHGWSMPPPPPYDVGPPRPPPTDQQRALLGALYRNNPNPNLNGSTNPNFNLNSSGAPRPPIQVYRPPPQGYVQPPQQTSHPQPPPPPLSHPHQPPSHFSYQPQPSLLQHQPQQPLFPPVPSQPPQSYASHPNMPFAPRPPHFPQPAGPATIPTPMSLPFPAPQNASNNAYQTIPLPLGFQQTSPNAFPPVQVGGHQQALLAQLHTNQNPNLNQGGYTGQNQQMGGYSAGPSPNQGGYAGQVQGQGQGRSPPKGVGGGQGGNSGTGYHHPVPRAAGAQLGGVLGGMIDGRR